MKDSFVIVTIGGCQHIVSVDDEITVNHLEGNVGDILTFDTVLLKQDDSKTEIGKPVLDYTVSAEIVKQYHGPKLNVRTFKAKARYRRNKGHRQPLTTLKITRIAKKPIRSASSKKASSSASNRKTAKEKATK